MHDELAHEGLAALRAHQHARMAHLAARRSPLTRVLNACERGTPREILDEIELHIARTRLGEGTLLDDTLDCLYGYAHDDGFGGFDEVSL